MGTNGGPQNLPLSAFALRSSYEERWRDVDFYHRVLILFRWYSIFDCERFLFTDLTLTSNLGTVGFCSFKFMACRGEDVPPPSLVQYLGS